MSLDWGGTDEEVIRRMTQYGEKARDAIYQLALYFAPILEAYAKRNAPWTDRTANARQALRGYVHDRPPEEPSAAAGVTYPTATDLARDAVAIYLSHGMSYGIYLETMQQGAYGIIWQTLQEHIPQIRRMLQQIFA